MSGGHSSVVRCLSLSVVSDGSSSMPPGFWTGGEDGRVVRWGVRGGGEERKKKNKKMKGKGGRKDRRDKPY